MSDYRRQTGVDKRATTQQSIDQASTQVKSADAQLREDEAAIKIADTIPQTLSQAQAQVDQAKAQVDQARAQLADAELNLSYTEIRAPQAGFITRRAVQLGTFAQAGQTLFALVTDDLWVTANFKENQLDRMRVGQHVDMTLDAYSQVKLGGHIDSIQMGTGSRFSAFPSENATGNYVKIVQRVPVKIVIDTGLDPNHPLPLGLSVNPAVQLK
jgi:membrane fusion protein (multidrug efflux system)